MATYLEQNREKGCDHQLAAKGSSLFASDEYADRKEYADPKD